MQMPMTRAIPEAAADSRSICIQLCCVCMALLVAPALQELINATVCQNSSSSQKLDDQAANDAVICFAESMSGKAVEQLLAGAIGQQSGVQRGASRTNEGSVGAHGCDGAQYKHGHVCNRGKLGGQR